MTASAESPALTTGLDLIPPRVERTGLGGLIRLPGVYRPQADSSLLSDALREAGMPAGARVLDLCTGTGAQAVTAARAGAESVLAVDLSRRALMTAWVNGAVRRLPIRVRRGDLLDAAGDGPFDVVIANPPYVPSPAPTVRGTRGWDAGEDGRAVLHPLCVSAPAFLGVGGFLLLVHSVVSGVETSLRELRSGGLVATIVKRALVPFGPVMRARAPFLEASGLIEPGQRTEELVVLRADRIAV